MKNMAKRNLICFALLGVLMIALCFVSITIPATTSKFVGFVPAITKDIDIAGGFASKYEITYEESVLDKKTELNETVNMLSSKLSAYGYSGASVSVGTNDNIYVELPKIKQSEAILQAIAVQGALYITTDSVDSINKATAISGDEVLDATSQFSQITASSYSWGVNIALTPEGQQKLASLTESATSSSPVTLNVYVGSETISQIGIGGQVDSPDLYFYGTGQTEDAANVTALSILMGKYGAEFDMINNEIIGIAPLINSSISTFILIAVLVLAALITSAFFFKFGECGFIVALNMVFFLTLTAFFMQALPIYVLSFAGVVALGIGMALFFVSNMMIFKTAQEGYAEGKKLGLSLKNGVNANVMKIVDMSVVALFIAVGVYFVGGVYAQGFALTLGITAALNMLTSLALNKLFIKWYTRVNTKDAKKVRFTREEQVNELD